MGRCLILSLNPGEHDMSLSEVITREMANYLDHLADRVEKHVRAVPKERVYVRPFPYGNSLGHLVLHLTGNLNHYIGAGIAGTGYVRHRELEFTDPNPPPPEEALARFRQAITMVKTTMAAQSEADWQLPVASNHPIQTRFGLFLVVIVHINNHIGQMAWLVQAQGGSTGEPPVW
jgi:uncharacterized damage-inducible protein DinB